MIKIFTGDDRKTANAAIQKQLGENHEVIDCAELTKNDLPLIFRGTTIFESHRRILLRDFTANASIYPELPNYLDTPHEIILFETKLDKRAATYKEIKDKVEIKEFTLPPVTDFHTTYSIFEIAKTDGKRAIQTLKNLEQNEDPVKFTGLLVSQALKDFKNHQGIKEKQVLKDLATIDLQMKTSQVDPWLLVESFLLNMSR